LDQEVRQVKVPVAARLLLGVDVFGWDEPGAAASGGARCTGVAGSAWGADNAGAASGAGVAGAGWAFCRASDAPVPLVDDGVMTLAQQDTVVDVGRSVVAIPPGDVVGLAPGGPDIAARKRTALVAGDQRA